MKCTSAGFWPRLAAFALDYLIIAVYIGALILISRLIPTAGLERSAAQVFGNPWLFDLFVFLLLVLPVALYFALSECSVWQGTWGKRCMRLRVSNQDGVRISLPRSLARSGLKFLPWQMAHTSLFHIPGWPFAVEQIPPGAMAGFVIVWLLVGSYLILLAFSSSHRTLYDRLAGTQVIKQTV